VKDIYLLLIIISTILMFSSCENNHIHFDDEGTYITDTLDAVDTIYFKQEIIPIIQTNCASCHFEGTNFDMETTEGIYNVLLDGNFIDFDDSENSDFFILPDPGHADDYLTVDEHVKIIDWIEQGALNN